MKIGEEARKLTGKSGMLNGTVPYQFNGTHVISSLMKRKLAIVEESISKPRVLIQSQKVNL